MDTKSFGRSDSVRPPPNVVWTFWYKKFEITKSISDRILINQKVDFFFLIGLGLVCNIEVHMLGFEACRSIQNKEREGFKN